VRDIYDGFMAAMEKWQHIDYAILDVDAAPRFGPDFRAFKATIKELERRLVQVRRGNCCAKLGFPVLFCFTRAVKNQ
jgi:hypothetical protein